MWYRASIVTAFAEAQALSLAKDLSRYSLTPSTTSAWQPLRGELGKVAEGYEMSSADLPAR
jgi:hypothetical protein